MSQLPIYHWNCHISHIVNSCTFQVNLCKFKFTANSVCSYVQGLKNATYHHAELCGLLTIYDS